MNQQEVIKTFMQSLDNTTLKGVAALNEAIRASSNFKSFNAVKTQFLEDINSAKNWHTFLVEKCGIILDDADTGAISGSNAGGSKVKTATNLLPAEGEAQYPDGDSFTVDGLTIYGIPDRDSLTEDQQYVIQGLYSWWIRDAIALIKESYGLSFDEEGATSSRLRMKFIDDEKTNIMAYVEWSSDDGKINYPYILCVNMAEFKNLSPSERNPKDAYGYALDRTLAHELTHAIMASNINYFDYLPGFLIEGGTAELIHGIDDDRYSDIISYTKDTKAVESILTTRAYNTYEAAPYSVYPCGYIFMRYFAKQAAADTTFDYDTYRATVSTDSDGGFITNYHDKVTMKGGDGDDTITNSGSNVSIAAGAGNDTIKNYYTKVKVNAGAGDDFIHNEGSSITITAGDGADSVLNRGENVLISGGEGDDSITNSASKVTISGGKGDDFINNFFAAAKSSINGGAGNDLITNSAKNVTIMGGSGKDTITNRGNNVTIGGGSGNDSITNFAKNAVIAGEAGNDTINNYGSNVAVSGDEGNDFITNSSTVDGFGFSTTLVGTGATLYGGAGNDTIQNECNKIKIYGEEGADEIANSGASVSVYSGEGNDYVENDGDTAFILLGEGNDTIENDANFVFVSGEAGKDHFVNQGDGSTLTGGSESDFILNYGDESSLAGDSGNDSIYSSGKDVTITGGAGNDSVHNAGTHVTILGGTGADSLYNDGDTVTLDGGKGNDYLFNDGGRNITYNFGTGYGNDTVVGFNANDSVKITSGTYSATQSGSDVIVSVGANTLTLKDATNKTINFIDSKDKMTSNLFNDNNLSSIVQNKISASYLTDFNYSSSLTKKNNLITYSGKK